MRKTDKKIDKQLRLVLTQVCEDALKGIQGFEWLTHRVNYDNFPHSLQVVCVFMKKEDLKHYLHSAQRNTLSELIKYQFKDLGIYIKKIENHIFYDTEESCLQQHSGNWAARLATQ